MKALQQLIGFVLSKLIWILFGILKKIRIESSKTIVDAILVSNSMVSTPDRRHVLLAKFQNTNINQLGSYNSDDVVRNDIPFRLVPDWAKEIQPFLANQLSAHTQKAYESDLKQFFSFISSQMRPVEMSQLKPAHIILFRKALEEGRITGKPLQKGTINRKLASIKSFLTWLKANHHIHENPASFVKGYPQSQESALKGLSDEETWKILQQPSFNSRSGSLHRAILHVLFYLGLRKGELIGLKIGDLDTERGVLVLKVRGKGHKVRILPVTASVNEAIENYFVQCRRDKNEKEAPLFIPTKNPRTQTLMKKLNPHSITYLVEKYARKAGVLKKISPHSCRATCVSNALDKKATHRSVQHLAGWSTPLMIQRYDKRREDLKNSAAFVIDYKYVDSSTPSACEAAF